MSQVSPPLAKVPIYRRPLVAISGVDLATLVRGIGN